MLCGAVRIGKAPSDAVPGRLLGSAELSSRLVAVARGISKSYGGRPVVRDFSARIMRGDRIGIVGPNGAGKTTLLNLLTGALMPDIGEVRLGTNLAPVILDQRREGEVG